MKSHVHANARLGHLALFGEVVTFVWLFVTAHKRQTSEEEERGEIESEAMVQTEFDEERATGIDKGGLPRVRWVAPLWETFHALWFRSSKKQCAMQCSRLVESLLLIELKTSSSSLHSSYRAYATVNGPEPCVHRDEIRDTVAITVRSA